MELSSQDLASLIDDARDYYIQKYRPGSMPTVCAVILFEMLRDDILTGSTSALQKISRQELKKRMLKRPDLANRAQADTSFGRVPEDIGQNLDNLKFKGFKAARHWRVTFRGPTARLRDNQEDEGLLYLTIAYESFQEVGATARLLPSSVVEFPDLESYCFCCGAATAPFDANNRECQQPNCASRQFSVAYEYVTLFPEPAASRPIPSPGEASPLFATLTADTEVTAPSVQIAEPTIEYQRLLPYSRDYLAEIGLHLGTPLVYRHAQLEAWTSFRRVYILDMSTYRWSNSLRDPQSWAIVNLALERGISTLVRYTHRNGALSLAKLVYEVNRRTNSDMAVYSLLDDTVSPVVESELRSWGSKVHKLTPRVGARVIAPQEAWRVLNASLYHRSSEDPVPSAWHVSDGWDGVGILVYRILFAELLRRRIHVDYVLVPAGSDNLLLGTHLALRDGRSPALLISAFPGGAPAMPTSPSELLDVPTLVGTYAPLTSCIAHLATQPNVQFIEVSDAMQREALHQIETSTHVAAEPSSLLAVGALRGADSRPGLLENIIQQDPQRTPRDLSVLVVNPGFDTFSEERPLRR
jgi:hypothetical protein